ncbi:MAG: hypothetical protein AAGH57_10075 [Pseudomonadota bacterium]
MTESNLALCILKHVAVFGANYPGAKWYERAYQLVEEHAGRCHADLTGEPRSGGWQEP